MTTDQRDRLTAAIQNYGFSARGHDWHVCVCATQEILGDRFLHLALVGEPLLTLTVQMPAGCNIRTAAAHIGDAIVDWLATADWAEHGSITLKLAS
jgi:hypothetical protein